jgi:hypothetical protein
MEAIFTGLGIGLGFTLAVIGLIAAAYHLLRFFR